MIRTTASFAWGVRGLAWPWWLWIALLGAVNLAAPLFFLGSLEARIVLAATLVGAMVQFAIVNRLGFVRLLGLGHILGWLPMLLWLVPRLGNLGATTPFGRWLFALVVVDLASLAIDFVDVARYLAGDRRPAPGTAPPNRKRRQETQTGSADRRRVMSDSPTGSEPRSLLRRANAEPLDPVAAGRATARQVLLGPDDGMPNFALRRFVMGEGGGMPRHTNTVEHEQYVLRGRARISVGDEVHDVGADDVLYIAAGVPHSYEVVEAPFEFICVVPNGPDRIELVEE